MDDEKATIQSALHRGIGVPMTFSLRVQGSWEGELPVTLNCPGNEVWRKLSEMT